MLDLGQWTQVFEFTNSKLEIALTRLKELYEIILELINGNIDTERCSHYIASQKDALIGEIVI